jgi:hypothetical protein
LDVFGCYYYGHLMACCFSIWVGDWAVIVLSCYLVVLVCCEGAMGWIDDIVIQAKVNWIDD